MANEKARAYADDVVIEWLENDNDNRRKIIFESDTNVNNIASC